MQLHGCWAVGQIIFAESRCNQKWLISVHLSNSDLFKMSQRRHSQLSCQQHRDICLHANFNVVRWNILCSTDLLTQSSLCCGIWPAGWAALSGERIDLTARSFSPLMTPFYITKKCAVVLCSLGKFYSPDNELPATFDLHSVILPAGRRRPWISLKLHSVQAFLYCLFRKESPSHLYRRWFT